MVPESTTRGQRSYFNTKLVRAPARVLILMCYHRTEKDKAPPSPLLTIHSDGLVRAQNDQMLVSTCRMRIHKFPFDVQICNLSFKSVVHSGQCANPPRVHISDFDATVTGQRPTLGLFGSDSQGDPAGSLPRLLQHLRHDHEDPV